MPSSPTSSAFPGSPPIRDTPNVHPYAIKTSSSAVLTRSNSTGHRFHANHHYTPPSPTKDPIGTRQGRYVPSRKHIKSLPSGTGTGPPPVPLPPSSSLPARLANQGANRGQTIVSDGEGIPLTPPLTWRVKRSDTLPSLLPSRSDTETNVQQLPKNPRIWTPGQLSVYLSSALRMKGGAKLPVPVARDIGLFVMKEHLSGRVFLRMQVEDYDTLGINQLWKDALLDASRVLRQNLVQGRILGFGSRAPLSSPSADGVLPVQEEEDPPSVDLPAYSPLDPTPRRSPSSAPKQWDEDKRRMSKTSFRTGRVRGMVETYERSCSDSSASGSEYDEPIEGSPGRIDASLLICEPAEDEGGFASGEDTSGSDDEGNMSMASATAVKVAVDAATGSSAVKTYGGGVIEAADAAEHSPSIEALLREQQDSGLPTDQHRSWGAKAWEDEVKDPTGVHATARRVSLNSNATTQRGPHFETQKEGKTVSAVSNGGSAPKGLTELFSELTIQEAPPPKTTKDASVGDEEAKNTVQTPGPAVYEALEAFQRRLDLVERQLDEMERMDAERDSLFQQAQSEMEQRHAQKALVIQGDGDLRSSTPLAHPTEYEPEPEEVQKRKVKNYTATDPSIAGLPGYMFLISLGVVAITMRVVLRRMIGDRRRT